MTPLGYCIFQKMQDPNYKSTPEELWTQYRLDNKYKLQRGDFDSQLEEMYEQKKDIWISQEQKRETGAHHEERFKLGMSLRKQPIFMDAGNKKKQRIIARQFFKDLTEQEIDDIVEIARMDVDLDEIAKLREVEYEEQEKEREIEKGQRDDDARKLDEKTSIAKKEYEESHEGGE